jgi:hypothetical protein
MTWFIFALIACMASCASIEIIRKTRLDGFEVLLFRSMIVAFALLPFFMYMDWPRDPGFYVMIMISSIIYAWGNIVVVNLATRKNGRVAMMFQPLMIFATFGIWLAIDPGERAALENDPQQLGLTALCLLVLLGSLHFIRRNDYAWTAFLAVAPVALGYAALHVAQKWFISAPDAGLGMILAIIMLGNFGMLLALPLLKRYRVMTSELQISHRPVFPVAILLLLAALHITSWGSLLHAMQLAVNPAYPVAIMALTPVLFHVYYWIRGWRDPASPVAGTVMTLSALSLGLIHL